MPDMFDPFFGVHQRLSKLDHIPSEQEVLKALEEDVQEQLEQLERAHHEGDDPRRE